MEFYLQLPTHMGKDNFPFYKDSDSVSSQAIDYKGSFLLGKGSQNVSLVT